MKIIYQLILISVILAYSSTSVFSQSPHIYNLPNTAHSLKLHKKGDLAFSFGAGVKNGSSDFPSLPFTTYLYDYRKNTTNLQLAYSPLNRFSISFNHDKIVSRIKHSGRQILHNSHIFGIGIGTYHTFKFRQQIILKEEKKEIPQYRKMLIDLHLGYNKGGIDSQYFQDGFGNVALDLSKKYIQGGLHYLGKKFELSYLLKFGQINYLKGEIYGRPNQSDEETLNSITTISNFMVWEKSLRAEYKFRQFGLFSQITITKNQEFSIRQRTTKIVHFGISVKFQNATLKNKNR